MQPVLLSPTEGPAPACTTPLHAAAASGSEAELARLLAQSPESAFAEDGEGWTALHTAAACCPPSPSAIRLLLAANPAAARARALPSALLPLHLAACGPVLDPEPGREAEAEVAAAASASVVALLLAASPEAAAAPERRGRCALHLACAAGAPPAVARALLAADRRTAGALDAEGATALHLAAAGAGAGRGAAGRASAAALALLADVAPSSAALTDARGRLALHLAAGCGAPPALLALLLQLQPGSASCADAEGRTPLHHLARCGIPASGPGEAAGRAEAAAALLAAAPDSLAAADKEGLTPLLSAFSNAHLCPLPLLESLAAAAAFAAAPQPPLRERCAGNGWTALHCAAACQASPPATAATAAAAIQLLLRIAPELGGVTDSRGASALHVACEAGAPAACVALLLSAHPPGATQHYLGLPPLAAWAAGGARSEADMDALYAALAAEPALARRAVHQLAPHGASAGLLGRLTDVIPDLPEALEAPFEAVGESGGEAAQLAPGPPLSALQLAAPAARAAMLRAGRLLRRFAPPEAAAARLWLVEDAKAPRGFPHRRVALKFLASRSMFDRELARRGALGGGARCEAYLPLLGSWAAEGPGADPLYAEESRLRALPPFLLMLPRADASLADALSARPDAGGPGGRDWRAARRVTHALLLALQPLHDAGLAHCALCPSHCVRLGDSLGGEWRLLGASAAASVARGEAAPPHPASAYAPPEAVGGEAGMKADTAGDMWALGCILYHVLVGAPLWPQAAGPAGAERLGQSEAGRLAGWDAAALDGCLAPLLAAAAEVEPASVSDGAACRGAAALLRWLLQPQPGRRPPNVYTLLGHAFLNPAGGILQAERWAASAVEGPPAEPAAAPPPPPNSPSFAASVVAGLGSPVAAPPSPASAARARSAVGEIAESIYSAVTSFNLSAVLGGGAAPASRAPPPAATVGAFPMAGLAALAGGEEARWADPLPPPPPGTVALTRSLVGVPAVEGGVTTTSSSV